MNIGVLAVDSNFPNLALMKISAYHKARGDQVEWYNPYVNTTKYIQLKYSLSHLTITIISMPTK